MFLFFHNLTIGIQCVKVGILYSRILLDQESSGSRPDGTTYSRKKLRLFLFRKVEKEDLTEQQKE